MNSGRDLPKEGFPHSDIRGSTIARISPRLFAACHVLHRLLAPRHPPNALVTLTIQPQAPARSTKPRTNHSVPNSKPTLTQHTHSSQIHLSMNDPGGDPVSTGGVSWKQPAAAGPEVLAQASPMPSCPRAAIAGHRERRAEPVRLAW